MTIKTLLLMRHAKSDWKQPEMSDHDRPLNGRGRRAAPAIAHQLSHSGLQVDVILASSAVRVQETVELLLHTWSPAAEVLTSRALYLASPQQIMSEIQSLHDSWNSAMVVAHNPGIAALVNQLAGRSMEMPTAAVAVFRWEASTWSELLAGPPPILSDYWKPRDLED